jgi:hypothetical protein
MVVRVGGSIESVCLEDRQFVLPGGRQGQRCERDQMALELAKGRSNPDFFFGTEHPGIEVPEPEHSPRLMGADVFDGGGQVVQGKDRQIETARRFGPPDRRGDEHCQRLVDRL